jgi:uncharacterized OB-fold protein
MTGTDAARAVADPRPVIVEQGRRHVLLGGRCASCGHALARRTPRCPWCRSAVEHTAFGPDGAIWAVTVVHVAAGDRDVPYTLAYLDLDDGPRLLVHLDRAAAVGERARLVAPTSDGDPAAEVLA